MKVSTLTFQGHEVGFSEGLSKEMAKKSFQPPEKDVLNEIHLVAGQVTWPKANITFEAGEKVVFLSPPKWAWAAVSDNSSSTPYGEVGGTLCLESEVQGYLSGFFPIKE